MAELSLHSNEPEKLDIDSFPKIIASGMLILGVFFGGLVTWAALFSLSSAVMTQGVVKVDLNRKTVQHREGGIVADILVREGDRVKAGQPLIILSDKNIEASASLVGNQLAQMLARMARLDAQRQYKPTITWPEELLAMEQTPEVRQAMEAEQNILREERRTLEGQIGLFQQQILGMQSQVAAEDRIIAAYQEELAAKSELQKNRYLEKTPILDLHRNLANHQANKSVTQQRIAETRLRIAEMRKDYMQKGTLQYADVQSRVVELNERKLPTSDAQSRLTVTAPVDGIVMDMTVFTKGAVVRPGERLLDIVPEDGALIVEADVQVRDIAKVHIGQDAKIQISAYTQYEMPQLKGRVTYVSPDRISSRTPTGEVPVYKIHAVIDKEELEGQRKEIVVGMPATVYVLTGDKSVLRYILDPLTLRLSHAMRE
jgi:HlyD family type I secretion membrane fusion protein